MKFKWNGCIDSGVSRRSGRCETTDHEQFERHVLNHTCSRFPTSCCAAVQSEHMQLAVSHLPQVTLTVQTQQEDFSTRRGGWWATTLPQTERTPNQVEQWAVTPSGHSVILTVSKQSDGLSEVLMFIQTGREHDAVHQQTNSVSVTPNVPQSFCESEIQIQDITADTTVLKHKTQADIVTLRYHTKNTTLYN